MQAESKDLATTIVTLRQLGQLQEAIALPCWLIGGLACAFRAGQFWRVHKDIDLVVRSEDLERWRQRLEAQRFTCCRTSYSTWRESPRGQ